MELRFSSYHLKVADVNVFEMIWFSQVQIAN